MEYKLIRNSQSDSLEFYENLLLKANLESNEFFKLSFVDSNIRREVEFKNLSNFFTQLDKLKNFKSLEIIFIDKDLKRNFVDISDLNLNQIIYKQAFKILYEREFKQDRVGFADYSFVNYFMPKWSTAYLFDLSNHSKLMEPLFTDIKLNSIFIEKLLKDDTSVENIIDKHDLLLKKDLFKTVIKNELSQDIKEGLIDTEYNLDSKEVLNFNPNSIIYIKRVTFSNLNLKIFGMSNNTFISEIIELKDDSIITLKLNYDKIYNVEVLDFENINSNIESISDIRIRISNMFIFENNKLNFSVRPDQSFFEIENSNLIHINKDKNKVFNLTDFLENDYVYVDSKDTIYKISNNKLQVGRVDYKLDLQIPRDMTYNNTKYIETTYLTSSEYLIELLALEYFKDTQKNKVSVTLKNSLGETYYLNSQSKLQTSDTEIFINLSELKKDKISFELTLDSQVEYILVTVNDFEGHYKKSNIILHPKIDFKDIIELDSVKEKLVLVNNKVSIFNTEDLTIKESLYD